MKKSLRWNNSQRGHFKQIWKNREIFLMDYAEKEAVMDIPLVVTKATLILMRNMMMIIKMMMILFPNQKIYLQKIFLNQIANLKIKKIKISAQKITLNSTSQWPLMSAFQSTMKRKVQSTKKMIKIQKHNYQLIKNGYTNLFKTN
jgi:hypothetical protein